MGKPKRLSPEDAAPVKEFFDVFLDVVEAGVKVYCKNLNGKDRIEFFGRAMYILGTSMKPEYRQLLYEVIKGGIEPKIWDN